MAITRRTFIESLAGAGMFTMFRGLVPITPPEHEAEVKQAVAESKRTMPVAGGEVWMTDADGEPCFIGTAYNVTITMGADSITEADLQVMMQHLPTSRGGMA